MNRLGESRTPYLWAISYDMGSGFIIPYPEEQEEVMWQVGEHGNCGHISSPGHVPSLIVLTPPSRERYAAMFATIRQGLLRGDSFLANLTGATEVKCSGTLRDVFLTSRAPFRLLLDDYFVCFSPEQFIRIAGREISTFPMKGTANAEVVGAREALLKDYKELCEHYTIVDLMRNDINSVAHDVHVRRFRYVENITTDRGAILQTSSEITGILTPEMEHRYGDIIIPLLPAGSITGAPKEATVALIKRAEPVSRGWYTGVFGYFDGDVMQTAVMIRCLQRDDDGRLYFHSGGGITVNSRENDEYDELLEKIYLPTNPDNNTSCHDGE